MHNTWLQIWKQLVWISIYSPLNTVWWTYFTTENKCSEIHYYKFLYSRCVYTEQNDECNMSSVGSMSWNKTSQTFFISTKILFFSNVVHTFVYIPVSEHFCFANIIHPLNRSQMHLVLGTIKATKIWNFVKQHNATDVSSFEEGAIGMLTAGMSTRAVARELNVHLLFQLIKHGISTLHVAFVFLLRAIMKLIWTICVSSFIMLPIRGSFWTPKWAIPRLTFMVVTESHKQNLCSCC